MMPFDLSPPSPQQFIQSEGNKVNWNWQDWFARVSTAVKNTFFDGGNNQMSVQSFGQKGIPGYRPITTSDTQTVQAANVFVQQKQVPGYKVLVVEDSQSILAGQIFGA